MTMCYPPNTDWSCTALTEEELDQLDAAQKAKAEALAWYTIAALSGFAVAPCPTTVRPCAARCSAGTWQTASVVGGSTFRPGINAQGMWVNGCGCSSGDNCGCTVMREIQLPGPVGQIVAVTIDGAALAPSAYRVDNASRLVRTDGDPWPFCQDMNLPDGDPGTFSVTYYRGFGPDDMVLSAAGELAYEFYLSCQGQECRLPNGVTSIVRQGITMEIPASLWASGITGIDTVDTVIRIYNPNGLKQPSRVLSPDIPRPRVRTF